MAKRIQPLQSGQAPSLLDANKGNELVNAINGLMSSKSSEKAQISGLNLKVLDTGQIILDVSQETVEILAPSETESENDLPVGGGGDDDDRIPDGFTEEQFTTIINGVSRTVTLLSKG